MKPTDLNSFNTLSNLVGKGTTLVVQSTRMDFETNTYVSELWKRSKGQWKSFKTGNTFAIGLISSMVITLVADKAIK